jgi:hypothetical protein
MPAGKYVISIQKENLPPEIECINNNQKIEVSPDVVNPVNLQLKVKERKIKTQKFVSPSISRLEKH